jgi:hypothetical protein
MKAKEDVGGLKAGGLSADRVVFTEGPSLVALPTVGFPML